MNSPPFFLYLFDDLSFAIYFGHLPCWQLFELLPFFVHCGFRIRNFHRLVHENELEHKIAVTQRVEPPSPQCDLCDPFQTLSRGLVSFYDACMLLVLRFCWIRFWFLDAGTNSFQLEIPTFPRVFNGFSTLFLSSGQINRCLSTFQHGRASVSR